MKCPKCGKDMVLGKISLLLGGYYYPYGRSAPFWAEKSYFTRATFPNGKDAEQKGVGFRMPVPRDMINVAYTNLPDAYACTECRVVLLECGS